MINNLHGNCIQARNSNSIITGTNTNCSLSAATPSGNPRQSRKDGLFVLSQETLLFKHDYPSLLSKLYPGFEGMGISAIDDQVVFCWATLMVV